MTPMFGDFQAREGIPKGAFYEEYYILQGFSIMQALYYLSAVAEATPNLPETPIGSHPRQVHIPKTRRLRHRRFNNRLTTLASGWPDLALFKADNSAIKVFRSSMDTINLSVLITMIPLTTKDFQFEPWLLENNFGPKTWIAIALPAELR